MRRQPIAMMNGDVEADLIYFQGGDLALAQQGLFEDLNPYVEKSTFIKSIMTDVNRKRMENYPYLIWLAPSRIQIPAMRKDWAAQLDSYEKLIADPTVDNYYNLFKEMKDKGLVEYAMTTDGGSGDSTVRLDSIFNQAFGVTGTIVKEDGKWIFSKESQAEKNKLEFYAKLYKDGLLDPEYLTDTWDTMEQKFYEGKTGIIAGTLSSTQIYDNKMRSVNGEESELVILPPAKGVAQGYRAEDVTKEERGFAMNIDSKNKDAAWAVHPMEHELSAFYDITHGAGLALLTPYWMQYVVREETLPRFVEYGVNVWGIDPEQEDMAIARQAITKTREFFDSIGMPSHLSELDIDDTHFDVMAMKAAAGGLAYGFVPLDKQDVRRIYEMAL